MLKSIDNPVALSILKFEERSCVMNYLLICLARWPVHTRSATGTLA